MMTLISLAATLYFWWYKRLRIFIIGFLSFLLSGYLCVKEISHQNKEIQYCGKVVSTSEAITSGKYAHSERYVIFYNIELKRNIAVRVSRNTIANIKEGQRVCFDLNKRQLEE